MPQFIRNWRMKATNNGWNDDGSVSGLSSCLFNRVCQIRYTDARLLNYCNYTVNERIYKGNPTFRSTNNYRFKSVILSTPRTPAITKRLCFLKGAIKMLRK